MPAQALIRKLSKSQVEAEITKLQAKELLEVVTQNDALLVRCKPGDGGASSVAGGPEALQAVCDADAKLVRAEAEALKKAEADAKAKAAISGGGA